MRRLLLGLLLAVFPAITHAQMLGMSLISTTSAGLVYTAGVSVTTNQTSVTTLYASGKIGIGTGSPSATLHIAASAPVIVLQDTAHTSATVAAGGWVSFKDSAGSEYGWIGDGSGSTNDMAMYATAGNVTLGAGGHTVTLVSSTGYVGIGTTNPGYLLDVESSSGIASYAFTSAQSYAVYGKTNHAQGVGVVGVNTSTGAIGGIGYTGYGVYCVAGSCGGTSSWSVSSDARLKERVQDLPDSWGLAAIGKLRPVTYHWRDVKRDRKEGEQVGFIAQDVRAVFPNLVLADKGNSTTITLAGGKEVTVQDPMSLKYELLVAPLVKAVQELKADNDNLRAEFEAYKRAHP